MNLFKSMRVFVKVADKGSLTMAAKALSLSPAMVGNYLQSLEDHLGEVLIHRTTRRQSLTDFGQQYYARCVEILGMVADAEASTSGGHAHLPVGKLCVAAPISFGSEALIPALKAFYKKYPDIEINLMLSDRNVDLIEDDIDLAIRIGKLPDSSLISRELCRYEMAVCASPSYLEQHEVLTDPDQLSNHNCIQYRSASTSPWKFHKNGNTKTVQVNGNLKVDDGRALRKAAYEGMGIIMQPRILLIEDIQNGRLNQLFQDFELPNRAIHLVYLRNINLPSKIRCLIDFLLMYFDSKN